MAGGVGVHGVIAGGGGSGPPLTGDPAAFPAGPAPPVNIPVAVGPPAGTYANSTPRPPYTGTPSSRPVWSYVVPMPRQTTMYYGAG
jgi:hypothetical protein